MCAPGGKGECAPSMCASGGGGVGASVHHLCVHLGVRVSVHEQRTYFTFHFLINKVCYCFKIIIKNSKVSPQ